ncbi:MAG: flagellar protein FlgN [Lachnospiraceae bacterium]|nr:flagellar protein FlgN [Lachnospiraceae bacterium]
MASLMEELIDTLSSEELLYRELIPVGEEKTRAIIANDLDSLQEITVRERELVDKTAALEKKREQVAVDIATVLGRDPKTITLEQIAQALKNQPDDQAKLQEVHDRLRRTVTRLQQINNQNKNLLKESMEMVEFNMNVIRSTRMSSGSSNYSSDASEVAGMAPQHGMFDAKQ